MMGPRLVPPRWPTRHRQGSTVSSVSSTRRDTLQLTDLLDEPHCLNPLNFFVSGEINTSAERGEGGGGEGRGKEVEGME